MEITVTHMLWAKALIYGTNMRRKLRLFPKLMIANNLLHVYVGRNTLEWADSGK